MSYADSKVKNMYGTIRSATFPPKSCVPLKTVVFNDEECKITEKELEPNQGTRPSLTEFEKELRKLINRFSMESNSNTPDSILAEYMHACLVSFDIAVRARERWYGRRVF